MNVTTTSSGITGSSAWSNSDEENSLNRTVTAVEGELRLDGLFAGLTLESGVSLDIRITSAVSSELSVLSTYTSRTVFSFLRILLALSHKIGETRSQRFATS